MACSYIFPGAFVDLDLNVPVPQLSLSSCENKHSELHHGNHKNSKIATTSPLSTESSCQCTSAGYVNNRSKDS